MKPIWILGVVLVFGGSAKAAKPNDTVQKANALVSAMKFDEAEALVRSGMKKSPGAHGWHLALGRVLLASGKPADAYLEMMYEGLRAGAEPSGTEAFTAADNVLLQNRGPEVDDAKRVRDAIEATMGDPLTARELLEGISKPRRSHFIVRFYLAEARLRANDAEPALKELRALSKEDPAFVPSVVLEALALRFLGKDQEAAAAAAKARKIAPKHAALKALDRLQEPLPSPLPTPLTRPATASPIPAP